MLLHHCEIPEAVTTRVLVGKQEDLIDQKQDMIKSLE